MNSFVKKVSLASLALGGLLLAACGDDSSSSGADLDNSFDMVLDKALYSYDSDDSLLTITYPACKVGSMGNLVWLEKNPDSVFKFKSYFDKKQALMIKSGITEPTRYDFDGGKFPVGFWSAPTDRKGVRIQSGMRFDKGGKFASVVHYSGECYAQDFVDDLFENNEAMAQTENALVDFYLEFMPPDKRNMEKEDIDRRDIKSVDCDGISLYAGLVNIEVDDLNESSGELTVSYKKRSCSLNFDIRYAINEKDCKAAYKEFDQDKQAKEFDFKNYSMNVKYDEYCIAQLVLDLKRNEKIPLKKTASTRSESKDFAKGVVGLLLNGMK